MIIWGISDFIKINKLEKQNKIMTMLYIKIL